MSEPTPGPWYVTPIYMPYDYEDAYGGEPVCWRVTDKEPWSEDGEHQLDLQVDTCDADARLIAASPELLSALEGVVRCWETEMALGHPIDRYYYTQACAAITNARAEG